MSFFNGKLRRRNALSGELSNQPKPQGTIARRDQPQGTMSRAEDYRATIVAKDRPRGTMTRLEDYRATITAKDRPQGTIAQAESYRATIAAKDRPQGTLTPAGGYRGAWGLKGRLYSGVAKIADFILRYVYATAGIWMQHKATPDTAPAEEATATTGLWLNHQTDVESVPAAEAAANKGMPLARYIGPVAYKVANVIAQRCIAIMRAAGAASAPAAPAESTDGFTTADDANGCSAPAEETSAEAAFATADDTTPTTAAAADSAQVQRAFSLTRYAAAAFAWAVEFLNYDRTLLWTDIVKPGEDCTDPVAAGLIEAPAGKPATDQWEYGAFTGWSLTRDGDASEEALANVTGPRVLYPAFEKIFVAPKDFATATWAQIAHISESGKAREYFAVGDTKTCDLGQNIGVVQVMILGFDHDDLADGTGKAGVSIGVVNTGLVNVNGLKSDGSNTYNYQEKNIYRQMLTDKAKLPADLKAVIKPVTKRVRESTSVNTYTETLWYFSANELGNILANYEYTDGSKEYEASAAGLFNLAAYSNDGTDIARSYWLRNSQRTTNIGVNSESNKIGNFTVTSYLRNRYGFCI